MKTTKLTKLKSALKKLPSFSNRNTTASSTATATLAEKRAAPTNLFPVYVGKSRRRYLLTPEVIAHPLFQVMVERSDGSDVLVSCEVVMFDHMLWMIENSADTQFGSMDELVDYYTY